MLLNNMFRKNNILIMTIFFLFFSSGIALGDKARVILNFHISNVASSDIQQPQDDTVKNIPYKEIKKIYASNREQISLQRKISMDLHIINYQVQKELFLNNMPGLPKDTQGYHLFDIMWYAPRFYITYENKKNGRWEKVFLYPPTLVSG